MLERPMNVDEGIVNIRRKQVPVLFTIARKSLVIQENLPHGLASFIMVR
jgi:hypothetical protein